MLDIYLPIAQVNVDIFLLLFLSLAVGVLSGLFGVGGGFLMTPFLIFMGIPPVYAVPNEVNNILATSVSGSLTHWYKNTLDYKMGLLIVSGGVLGTIIGITTFSYFSAIGKISLIISLLYMYLLAIVGTLMLIEGIKEKSLKKKKDLSKIQIIEFSILFIILNYLDIALKKLEDLSEIEFLSKNNESLKSLLITSLTDGKNKDDIYIKIENDFGNTLKEINENSNIQIITANKTNQEVSELLEELIDEHREEGNLKKIESLEQKLINNLDENSYSELIKLKNQLNRE